MVSGLSSHGWHEVDFSLCLKKYEKLAQQDRARYDKEMAAYESIGKGKAASGGSSKVKSPSAAKSSKSDKAASSTKKGSEFKSEEFINDSDEEDEEMDD